MSGRCERQKFGAERRIAARPSGDKPSRAPRRRGGESSRTAERRSVGLKNTTHLATDEQAGENPVTSGSTTEKSMRHAATKNPNLYYSVMS